MNSIKDKEEGVPKTHLMSSYNQSTIQYIQNLRTPVMKNISIILKVSGNFTVPHKKSVK